MLTVFWGCDRQDCEAVPFLYLRRRLPSLVILGVEEPILSEDYAAITSEQKTVQVTAEFSGEVRSNSWWCASLCINEP